MTTEGENHTQHGRRPAPAAPSSAATGDAGMPASASASAPAEASGSPAVAGGMSAGQKSMNSTDRQSKPISAKRSRKRPVENPETISDLFERIYRETAAGRKPNLARNLWNIRTTPNESQKEVELVRQLAVGDPLLDALSATLVDVADIDLKDSVRRRILELTVVAFASHKLFEGVLDRLVHPNVEPRLRAAEISHLAGSFDFGVVTTGASLEITGAKRERLRVNAVTAFVIFRVLRDGWSKAEFITAFCELVWRVPPRFQGAQRVDPVTGEKDAQHQIQWRTVAMLANARSATESLSELKRHFEALIRERETALNDAQEEVAAQFRRAGRERDIAGLLRVELAHEKEQVDSLKMRVVELERDLEKEQSGRFADGMHAVDDYEVLRTQVIRLLSGQVNLLTDGLHALRNGSTAVADEFVDRVLSKIDAEVKRLKGLEGSAQ